MLMLNREVHAVIGVFGKISQRDRNIAAGEFRLLIGESLRELKADFSQLLAEFAQRKHARNYH